MYDYVRTNVRNSKFQIEEGQKKSSPNDSKSIPEGLVKEPLVWGDNKSAYYLWLSWNGAKT